MVQEHQFELLRDDYNNFIGREMLKTIKKQNKKDLNDHFLKIIESLNQLYVPFKFAMILPANI